MAVKEYRRVFTKPAVRLTAIIVVILIAAGVIGLALFVNKPKKTAANTTLTTIQSKNGPAYAATEPATAQNSQSNSTTTSTQTKNVPGYLVISQWGIKVKLGSANPNIVTYAPIPVNECGGTMTGNFTGCVELALKSSVTSIPLCEELGAGIGRQLVSTFNAAELKQMSAHIVGKYVYLPTGNPFSCGNQKLDTIREKYTGDNANKWTYSTD
jgi:hypothetical protein